ncbi:hypothetical protein DEM27_21960 [Metarhizobium album]|uniref:EAL domain-containing protein n=1 Tax=Metarhizobium album TaxID=2182425 RepID=A0A2U2DL51_9HYPH|nr:hypothetical protein [Rhizobium album]PWE54001.1 hypothetical protein DEM27_21960 [Rhizobium album]
MRLRFPRRDAEFDLGVEVVGISVLIAQGAMIIERDVTKEALEQLLTIAERFRYAVSWDNAAHGMVSASFSRFRRKLQLRVV